MLADGRQVLMKRVQTQPCRVAVVFVGFLDVSSTSDVPGLLHRAACPALLVRGSRRFYIGPITRDMEFYREDLGYRLRSRFFWKKTRVPKFEGGYPMHRNHI